MKVLLLMTGGAIGTVLRYGTSTWIQRTILHSFPWGTFSVNIIGSFLIGFCWSVAEQFNVSVNVRLFLFTGIFGGFTTFSSFTLETLSLFRNGVYKLACLNLIISNLLGLLAVFAGLYIGKQVLTYIK